MKKLWLIQLFLFASTAWAGTYTAASCSYTDVNAVINGPTHTAISGDVIIIPSGSCTWASGITISSVGIDITGTGTPNTGAGTVGAGTPNTTLIDNASAPLLTFSGLAYGQTAKVELLIMSASGAAYDSLSQGAISITGSCTSSGCALIRVDNINFTANTWESPLASGGFITIDNVFGVVDHTTTQEATSGSPALVQVNYDAWKGVGTYGDNSFASADTLGTQQAMYMENNSLNGVRISENDVASVGGQVGGARYVGRFNTITNMSATGICSGHGTAWTGRPRGQRQIECYYNTVTTNPAGCNAITGINAGTGYYFSNAITAPAGGGCNEFLQIDVPRSNTGTTSPWLACDGTEPWDKTPWSSSSICLDQPGYGAGQLLQNSTPVFASSPGTACTTAGQCYPTPAADPIYEAGDTLSGPGALGCYVYASDGSNARILANRDFYCESSNQAAQTSATSPFNGTTGTGHGTLAYRPTTCTTGVGYWATDQGTWNNGSSGGVLSICTAMNTWTSSYTPYTYPHPLDSGLPNLSPPTSSPVAGAYGSAQTVTLSAAAGAAICYTVDGSTPTAATAGTCSHGTTYSTGIAVSATTTINAIATESGYTNSTVASSLYVISVAAAGQTVLSGLRISGSTP